MSLRAPGSTVDGLNPSARVGDAYFKGSGTSQAAAIVSGVLARMFDADPALTPDEAKAALIATGEPHAGRAGRGRRPDRRRGRDRVRDAAQGDAGSAARQRIRDRVDRASAASTPAAARSAWSPTSTGTACPEDVTGEVDVLGRPWDAAAYAADPWTPASFAASPWAALVDESSAPAPRREPRPARASRGRPATGARRTGSPPAGMRRRGRRGTGARGTGGRSDGSDRERRHAPADRRPGC